MKLIKFLLITMLWISPLLYPNLGRAANAWYSGTVTMISFVGPDGSFVIRFNTTALSDCQYQYVRFKASQIGAETTKEVYAMAMTSLVDSRQMNVVIDKTINGTGGECDATGMVASLN